jgi:phosphopantothenoylcysteine decarboxylase/phosphopantothenate--cysteine ligase
MNDVSRSEIGFESERNEVTIVERDGATQVPISAKEEIADAILDRVDAMRAASGAPDPRP